MASATIFAPSPLKSLQAVVARYRLENRGVPDASTVVAGFRGKELDVIRLQVS